MKKKMMALSLGAALVAGVAAPAFADGYDWKVNDHDIVAGEDGMSTEEVEYNTELGENPEGSESADVYAIVGSTYQVTIPKVIVLKGAKRGEASTATYKVDVDGDIAGDEYVKVAPAATVTMKQAGKADVTGEVAQEITKFRASNNVAELAAGEANMAADDADEIANGEGTGSVSAMLTAGKWNGSFNFDIALEKAE